MALELHGFQDITNMAWAGPDVIVVQTSPLATLAAEIETKVKALWDPVKASRWMFLGKTELDGQSPIDAIRNGRIADVRKLVEEIEQKERTTEGRSGMPRVLPGARSRK